MKQVFCDIRNGNIVVEDVPAPVVTRGRVLVRTRKSLISSGTERMLVDFGKSNLLQKAKKQPEKVSQVLDKMRTDGILSTLEAVNSKLDQPLPLGYCNVGEVIAVGEGVRGLNVGDIVASNGYHAEIVSVPYRLCAKVPEGVSEDAAVFTVLGAIALEGIRLSEPTFGECFVVVGLGLIGLMTVQLLRANGCRVLGVDMNDERLALAGKFGAETVNLGKGDDIYAIAERFSRGRGVDGVLITAATDSSKPVNDAARICRKRGRIVLVGVSGLSLNRDQFFRKELSFSVSCSYGPGRYDPEYEEKGIDYPVGYVRWTEQRNFEAVLDALNSGQLDVSDLVSHRFPISNASDAYHTLTDVGDCLGIVLEYHPEKESGHERISISDSEKTNQAVRKGVPVVSFIGAGNYAGRILIPAFEKAGASFCEIATTGGVGARHYGKKHGFRYVTTNVDSIFDGHENNVVVIASRHDSHSDYVCRALRSGKHVFVEKPLALTHEELDRIESTIRDLRVRGELPLLMIGFNRRFAPAIVKMKSLISGEDAPKFLVMTINAGSIPADHWTQDREIGGGRIIGEACHFVDLMRFLVGAPVRDFSVGRLRHMGGAPDLCDNVTLTLEFDDGSVGTVHYIANGSRAYPKERLEIFHAGRVLQMDNFRRLTGYGYRPKVNERWWRQDKGQVECVRSFLSAVESGCEAPIPLDEILEVSRLIIDMDAAACGKG